MTPFILTLRHFWTLSREKRSWNGASRWICLWKWSHKATPVFKLIKQKDGEMENIDTKVPLTAGDYKFQTIALHSRWFGPPHSGPLYSARFSNMLWRRVKGARFIVLLVCKTHSTIKRGPDRTLAKSKKYKSLCFQATFISSASMLKNRPGGEGGGGGGVHGKKITQNKTNK